MQAPLPLRENDDAREYNKCDVCGTVTVTRLEWSSELTVGCEQFFLPLRPGLSHRSSVLCVPHEELSMSHTLFGGAIFCPIFFVPPKKRSCVEKI